MKKNSTFEPTPAQITGAILKILALFAATVLTLAGADLINLIKF